jgi:hypothetical protein
MKIRLGAATFTACNVLLFSALSLNACTNGPAPDFGERDAAVSSVMQALHARDKDRLVKLAQPGPRSADPYARMLLSEWGGVNDSGYTTVYEAQPAPDIVDVRVSTEYPSGRPADIQFSLRWNDRDWLLNIGPDF